MDGGWDLGRDAMIRKRTDETNRDVRRAGGDDGEVGMLGFTDIGEAIETATEFDDLPLITQGVERVGVHSERDQIASAQRSALGTECFECSVEIARLHGG